MKNNIGRFGVIAVATAAIALAGCDGFFDVKRPNIVDSATVDPTGEDVELFAWSAYQNMVVAYNGIIVYGAWFTNEARVGDTFPTRNDFGLRRIDERNSTHTSEIWRPFARATASTEEALALLSDAPDADRNINLARVALASGYTVQLMAETFCDGVIDPLGSRQDADKMLDRAIARFKRALDVATAAGAADLANAARVGLARAYLQKGMKDDAVAVAKDVPATFKYDVVQVDDPSNRTRLGNNVFYFTAARPSLVVGPEWRAIADAGDTLRVRYKPLLDKETDEILKAQDGELDFYQQDKFPGYGSSIRLASGLEARYIVAEAEGNLANMIDLINERRAANGQSATFNSADANAVLSELMEQRARDFWLEGKRLGDWRRNPDNVPYILAAGSTYYKAGQGTIGDQVCMPMSASETDNNPNF